MRLVNLTESLHSTMELFRSDARAIERGDHPELGVVELKPNWENDAARLIHRYDKLIQGVYNSFNDPEGSYEDAWIQAHFSVTFDFLLKHKLARKVDEDV